MTTVLDAFAVIAYLCDEPAAVDVEELFTQPTVMSAVNLTEVIDQFIRVHGSPADDVLAETSMLGAFGLVIEPLSARLATEAALLRSQHYDRTLCPVSLADCAAAATALDHGAALATADPHLAAVMRAEGGDVVGLPDSQGRRP